MLLAVVAPFFTTYLIRTLAWETILCDHGIVVDTSAGPWAWWPTTAASSPPVAR